MPDKPSCIHCGCDFEELSERPDGTHICDHCWDLFAEEGWYDYDDKGARIDEALEERCEYVRSMQKAREPLG
nr:hypothetical protein [Pseudomonas sp.]